MATRKRKHDDDHDYDDGGNGQQPPYEEEGSAVEVHRAYLEHRVKGGAPPTPERFRRAIEQFQKLPGAVRSTPIDILKPPAAPDDDEGNKGAGE
jgi:hypothetical protein